MAVRTPSKLGRYEILGELGKGAMGVVYLARDPLIRRSVALKTFRAAFGTGDEEVEHFRTRFIREAQSAGGLNHPGIVTIHDVVEQSEEGATFIAMEYVEGTNLKQLLQKGEKPSHAFAADIVGQVADALDYAHQKGVVHRDIKPANIILTGDNTVKITDFGIARMDALTNLTHDGQLLGTPNYMSPEQVQGKDVDRRADIFSLGVVFYEMLTLHKPFQGDNLTVVSHRIVYDEFTPPEQYVRDLPPGLRRILERALAKDADRRYQHARELGDDLRALALGPMHRPADRGSGKIRLESPLAEKLNETRDASGAQAAARVETAEDAANQTLAAELPELTPPPASPAGPEETLPADGSSSVGRRRSAFEIAKDVGTQILPPEKRPPRWRVIAYAAGGALLLVAGIVGILLLRGSLAVDDGERRDQQRAEWTRTFAEQVQLGRGRLAAGDAGAAAEALRRAQRLAEKRVSTLAEDSRALREAGQADAADALEIDLQAVRGDEEEVRQLLLQAEWGREQALLAELRTAAVGERLGAARAAHDQRRYQEARGAALAALELDPTLEEAYALVADTERRLARRGAPEVAPPPPPAEPPARVAQAATTPPPTPEPAEATLAVSFHSEASRGTLILYVGNDQLLREDFGSGGLFRRSAEPASFDRQLTVARGTRQLRVIVSVRNRPGQTRELSANFPGGSTRTLTIRVDKDGGIAATLL